MWRPWDLGEPFIDVDANGTFTAGEFFVDTNVNGVWDAGNGLWDGPCLAAAVPSADCSGNTAVSVFSVISFELR